MYPPILASPALFAVGGVVVLILVAVAAYYAARFMKGSLKLELNRDAACSGERITGRVKLQAKKPIHGTLKVSLVGREKRRKSGLSGDNNSTKWVEVYRQDQVLEETRDFEAGFSQQYDFEITAPNTADARPGGAALRAAAEQAGEGVLGSVIHAAAGAADFIRGHLYWHIESRLDADGVDLFTKDKCQINLRD